MPDLQRRRRTLAKAKEAKLRERIASGSTAQSGETPKKSLHECKPLICLVAGTRICPQRLRFG